MHKIGEIPVGFVAKHARNLQSNWTDGKTKPLSRSQLAVSTFKIDLYVYTCKYLEKWNTYLLRRSNCVYTPSQQTNKLH